MERNRIQGNHRLYQQVALLHIDHLLLHRPDGASAPRGNWTDSGHKLGFLFFGVRIAKGIIRS
jgi:hypothetical protein